MQSKRKFVFTQISAVLVMAVAIIGSAWLIRVIFGPTLFEVANLRGSDAIIPALAIVIVLIFLTGLALWIWGRLLVMGILTAEEARGYPFSRPWRE
jgi:hypothetical protein